MEHYAKNIIGEQLITIAEKYSDVNSDEVWKRLSANNVITMEIIQKYFDKPWNWEWVSLNPNLTIKFVKLI